MTADEQSRLLPAMESTTDTESDMDMPSVRVKRTGWRGCCAAITVEPPTFIYAFYLAVSVPMMQQYIYARVALDHNTTITSLNNLSLCSDNHSDPHFILHQEVQHTTSAWVALLSAVQLPFTFVATMLFGSYSDKGGRKPGLFVPLLGGLVKTGFLTAITILELPKEVLIAAVVAEGLSGAFGTFLMSTFSYISDVTGYRNRAFRIVVVESALGVGVVAGSLVFGMLPFIGFVVSYLILGAAMLLAVVYVAFVLKESRIVVEKPEIFTTEHLKRLIHVYTVNDDHGRRWKLLISVAILIFASMSEMGRTDAFLLFVENAPLCWNATFIGTFAAISFVLSTLGSIVLTKVLQHRVHDMTLSLIGALSCVAQNVVQAFSSSSWMIFVAAVIGMFGRMIVQLLRSFTSKVVKPDEQGAMYAAFAMIQVAAALCGSVFFTSIYNVTLAWMPGFTFLVMAAFCLICAILAGLIIILQKRFDAHYTVLAEERVE